MVSVLAASFLTLMFLPMSCSAQGMADPEKVFEKIDGDKDGKVSVAEAEAFFKSDFEQAVFDQYDTDHDNLISLSELKAKQPAGIHYEPHAMAGGDGPYILAGAVILAIAIVLPKRSIGHGVVHPIV